MATERQVILGQTIVLEIDVIDARGNKTDADSAPSVEIKDPLGQSLRSLSSSGVLHIKEGRYRLNFTVPNNARTGIWTDHWRATVNGFTTEANLNFIVLTAASAIDAAGSQIGDDPADQWTEAEIDGINILLHQLKCRVKNDVMAEVTDAYGNIVMENCPIFSDDELVCFLQNSLSEFNQTPHFTNIGFDSPIIYERNANIIVEGAFIIAMAAQMLIEAGREFSITDNGIGFTPNSLSDKLNNELSTFHGPHLEKLKFIKGCMKPAPLGFGSFRTFANPNFMRLRHLRERRII